MLEFEWCEEQYSVVALVTAWDGNYLGCHRRCHGDIGFVPVLSSYVKVQEFETLGGGFEPIVGHYGDPYPPGCLVVTHFVFIFAGYQSIFGTV